MKVTVWFIVEGKKEYTFITREALDDFVRSVITLHNLDGGVRRMTIRY